MAIINLRSFYPWYNHDEYVEVPDVIAAELFTDRRYEKAHTRRTYRNKAQYSLDVDNGIENSAVYRSPSPQEIYEMQKQICRLCVALNSLPDTQGRRVEAHYLLGMSKVDIARSENVSEKNVRNSIERGLTKMRQYWKNNF